MQKYDFYSTSETVCCNFFLDIVNGALSPKGKRPARYRDPIESNGLGHRLPRCRCNGLIGLNSSIVTAQGSQLPLSIH